MGHEHQRVKPCAREDSRTQMWMLLRTWNPSNVLCTAREIITLWVSRMVMMNLYRITSYNVCYTKLLRPPARLDSALHLLKGMG